MMLGGIVRVGHCAVAAAVLRCPLIGARRALGEFPFVLEQVLEVVVAPLCRRGSPDHLQAAGDGVASLAGFELARPSKALRLDRSGFRFRAHIGGRAGAVGFAESVTTGNQSYS